MKKAVNKSLYQLTLEGVAPSFLGGVNNPAAQVLAKSTSKYLGGCYVKTKAGWEKIAKKMARIAATRAVSLSAYDAKRLADGCSCGKCQTLRAKELAHVRA